MINAKILRVRDLEAVISFEKDLLIQNIEDEMEREFSSWEAPWRMEALEHYLPLGWSFALWEGEEAESPLMGYFLGQPLLFFKGLTQSLWVEHMQARTPDIKNELIDIAYKVRRS